MKATYAVFAAMVLLLAGIPIPASGQGTLAPVPQQVFQDNSGNPLVAGRVYTYVAGTTTPLPTYTDAALSVPHTNPIILTAAGRPPAGGAIYLGTSAAYKFVVQTSGGATIYTQDHISPTLSTSVAASDNSTCNARLTLTSGTPVTTSDVTAATTVYVTTTRGNRCALYSGSAWVITSFSELSLSIAGDTANQNYDVFLFVSGGTPAMERVAWTNDSTRAVALSLLHGVYVKSSDTTKRYVGTYRTTGTIGQTEDSVSKRFVWSYYNRVPRILRVTDATDSWTYTTAAYRQVRGDTANKVEVVVGLAEATVALRAVGLAANGTATTVSIAIGEDGTVPAVGLLMAAATAQSAALGQPNAQVFRVPTAGYHYYTWLEHSAATGTTTWYGDAGTPSVTQTGMTGTIEG